MRGDSSRYPIGYPGKLTQSERSKRSILPEIEMVVNMVKFNKRFDAVFGVQHAAILSAPQDIRSLILANTAAKMLFVCTCMHYSSPELSPTLVYYVRTYDLKNSLKSDMSQDLEPSNSFS
jgi:hypothetical protein